MLALEQDDIGPMIVVHHLNHSRSSRVLWLLEELEYPYELVRHERLPGFRAPPSLKNVHPSGKAPIVEFDGVPISESAVILTEIHDRHGGGRFVPAIGTGARLLHDEWLHFAEGSAGMPMVTSLYGQLLGGLPGLLGKVVGRDVAGVLDRIEGGLQPGPHLMGQAFTLADIQMAYLLELADYLDLIEGRRVIKAYLNQLQSRPAYERAMEIGGAMMPSKAQTVASK